VEYAFARNSRVEHRTRAHARAYDIFYAPETRSFAAELPVRCPTLGSWSIALDDLRFTSLRDLILASRSSRHAPTRPSRDQRRASIDRSLEALIVFARAYHRPDDASKIGSIVKAEMTRKPSKESRALVSHGSPAKPNRKLAPITADDDRRRTSSAVARRADRLIPATFLRSTTISRKVLKSLLHYQYKLYRLFYT